MPSTSSFTARLVASIAAVDPAAWDACANPPGLSEDEAEGERFNPFVAHAFLHALEASGSTGGRSGWTPAHVIVEDSAGRIVAAAPSYLKSHSLGEYVFDHAWADAYERAGGRYYPKLQVAAPFTPATGPPAARREPTRRRARARRWSGPARGSPAGEGLVDPRDLPDRRGRGPARARRLSGPPRRAVPLPLRRILDLRRFSRRARLAQAQGDQARAAGGARRRRHDRMG